MPTYKYKFCDGTTSEVEVSEEHFALLKKMDKEEKQNDRRHRRQNSPPKRNKADSKDNEG